MSDMFHISQYIPKPPPTETKSIRFPVSVIETIEREICGKDCTFSAFVVAAVRYALDSLEEQRRAEEKDGL